MSEQFIRALKMELTDQNVWRGIVLEYDEEDVCICIELVEADGFRIAATTACDSVNPPVTHLIRYDGQRVVPEFLSIVDAAEVSYAKLIRKRIEIAKGGQ